MNDIFTVYEKMKKEQSELAVESNDSEKVEKIQLKEDNFVGADNDIKTEAVENATKDI